MTAVSIPLRGLAIVKNPECDGLNDNKEVGFHPLTGFSDCKVPFSIVFGDDVEVSIPLRGLAIVKDTLKVTDEVATGSDVSIPLRGLAIVK